MTTTYRIEKVAVSSPLHRDDERRPRSVVWENDAGVDTVRLRDSTGGGDDEGFLIVRIAIDGDFDGVYAELGQTGDLQALDRAITTLADLREHLTEMYGERAPVGRCLVHGHEGRCLTDDGHPGDHSFPLHRPRD